MRLGGERQCGSSVSPKNTIQCPQPGSNPRLLSPEMSMRPRHLPQNASSRGGMDTFLLAVVIVLPIQWNFDFFEPRGKQKFGSKNRII